MSGQHETTELDLTEAMEVWLRAKRAWDDPDSGIGRAPNQAAARVIATALEARDARIRELEGALTGFVVSLTSSLRNREAMLTINHDELVKLINSARAILTKQEPKS